MMMNRCVNYGKCTNTIGNRIVLWNIPDIATLVGKSYQKYFMKYYSILLLLIASCTQQPKDEKSQNEQDYSGAARREIWNTDVAMSELAVKEGFKKTLLAFADDSLVKPEPGILPVIGIKALELYWQEDEDFKNISWKPFKVEAAKSGELGYTLGDWQRETPDTTYYGNYYTIWKKQSDGKWKWVVDGGNNTPAPNN
ncbi:MAG TPA: hypothetical protein VMZ69_09235 [Saprospiraceae bacterium]|nr:hypothetical protein [Saprospiraceae bacterium]